MRQSLVIHPQTPCAAASSVEVEIARSQPGRLGLAYELAGDLDKLQIPPVGAPLRTDELWLRTCFEAFIRPWTGEAYVEVNVAPSTEWAAYRFSRYRADMRIARGMTPPHVEVRRTPAGLQVAVMLDLGSLSGFPTDAPWRLALSAVIEEAGGAKSYWALAHPPGKPDFHHEAGFTLQLPPAERP